MDHASEWNVRSADTRWLRALATRLTADADLADDLAQDTWLRAASATEVPRSRGWLAEVLRRRWHELHRAKAARDERERRSAMAEALPSTLDVVERAATQRELLQAVLELDEPYRTTLLWRYFEDLPPREIARRASISVATVHTRLARAHAKLRERLDRAWPGGRSGWMAMLLPLGTNAPHATGWNGTLLMKTAVKVSLSLLVVAVSFGVFVALRDDGQDKAGPTAVAQDESTDRRDPRRDEPATPPTNDGARTTVGLDGAVTDTARAISGAADGLVQPALRGRVLDARGRALAGVRVAPRGARGDAAVVSEVDGRFELRLEGEPRDVVCVDERYATVHAGSATTLTEALVVVAPRVSLSGRVVDESRTPLRDVAVAIHLPRGFGTEFGVALDASLPESWGTVSASDGRFAFVVAPAVEGAMLLAALGGFANARVALPMQSRDDLEIVLARSSDDSDIVHGIVLDARGTALAQARVALGDAYVTSDANGRFEIDGGGDPRPTRLTAVFAGLEPGVLEREGERWPEPAILRLGGATRSIRGMVLDPAGKALEGARVWLADPTPFGLVRGEPVHVEPLSKDDDQRFWSYVVSDAEGRFEIGGLLAREYRLRVHDLRTLLETTSAPIAAGASDVVLRLPTDALHSRVLGRVVGHDGAGIADVDVAVQRPAFEFTFADGGSRDEWSQRPPVRTDSDGSFELIDVPRDGVELFAFGDPILFASLSLGPAVDPSDVRIVADRRTHLQIELAEPLDRADSFRVLDAAGTPMILRVMRGNSSFTNRTQRFENGRSEVISLGESGRTLVLYRADAEVARVPLTLTRAGVNRVRW